MIAFTMSPSFARSALTALDREQDAWDMTSSTSSSGRELHQEFTRVRIVSLKSASSSTSFFFRRFFRDFLAILHLRAREYGLIKSRPCEA